MPLHHQYEKLEVNDPKLPRKRKIPSRYGDGEALAEFVSTVEKHFRQFFYQTIDMIANCIRDRFLPKCSIETFQTKENLKRSVKKIFVLNFRKYLHFLEVT